MIVSEDAGKSFAAVWAGWRDARGRPLRLGSNPTIRKIVLFGMTAGLWFSYNSEQMVERGKPSRLQFYHVSFDDQDPYHVYGGCRTTVLGGGFAVSGGITGNSRWENVFNGDGFFTFRTPSDPR